MPYIITEQGDLGLGLEPMDENVYNEAVNNEEPKKDNKDND